MNGKRPFSLYDVEQFIREAGAERVTEDAVLLLEKELERITEKIADKAARYAEHAGRKRLIKKSDIMLAHQGRIRRIYSRPRSFAPNPISTNIISSKER